MPTDELEKKLVEELFLKYRENYEKLRKLNEKKGKNSSNLSPSVKVLGEEMSSWTLTSEPFDFAIHTCGRKTYPERLTANTYFMNHWTFSTELSEAQDKLIRDSYKELEIDLSIFAEAASQARGMWVEFIGESRRRRKIPSPNLTGQMGDIMGVLASNFSEILELDFSEITFSSAKTKIGTSNEKFVNVSRHVSAVLPGVITVTFEIAFLEELIPANIQCGNNQ